MKLARLLLLLSAVCFGQYDTATVLGTVIDASGAVVSQAKLILENLDTGVLTSTATDSAGNYEVLSLPLGLHEVREIGRASCRERV